MGSKIIASQNTTNSLPNANYWIRQQNHYLLKHPYYGEYVAYRNKINGKKIHRYQLQFQTKQQAHRYQFHCEARNKSAYLVNVFKYYQVEKPLFCSSLIKYHVYINQISIRLNNLKRISFYQGIYTLINCILGFSQIYSQVGYFEIRQDHICISKLGEVKVWLNRNLSLNQPQNKQPSTMIREQELMIKKVIQIVQAKQQSSEKFSKFSQYCKTKRFKIYTFAQAYAILKCYSSQMKQFIPNYISPTNLEQIIQIPLQMCNNSKVLKKKQLFRRILSLSKKKTNTNSINKYTINQQKNPNLHDKNQIKKLKLKQKNKQHVKQHSYSNKTLVQYLITQNSENSKTSKGKLIFKQYDSKLIHKCHKEQKIIQTINSSRTMKAQTTSTNTPRDQASQEICKYKTVNGSIQLDRSIAEDLLKYL